MNRREFLRHSGRSAGTFAIGAGVLLQGCDSDPSLPEPDARAALRFPRTEDAADALLTAGAAELGVGSHASRGWGYNGTLPGPTLRVRVGAGPYRMIRSTRVWRAGGRCTPRISMACFSAADMQFGPCDARAADRSSTSPPARAWWGRQPRGVRLEQGGSAKPHQDSRTLLRRRE
jgi:hypothetical protein